MFLGGWYQAYSSLAPHVCVHIRVHVYTFIANLTLISYAMCVLTAGERRDSATYVRMKRKGCEEVGIASYGFDFPSSVTEAELIQ